MPSEEAIYQQLVSMMEELFEIEPSQVVPDALLADDLDIDSIDAVDMAARLHELTGQKIQPAAFREIRTVQDLVNAAQKLLDETGSALPA